MLNVEKVINGPFKQNAYVAWNKSHSFIIDPGGGANRIIDIIKSNDLSPSAILNTHAHLDHIGAIQTLIQYGKYPFYLHKDEIQLLESANEYTKMFGTPNINIPTVDYILDQSTILDFSGFSIEVLETPGHTAGGVSFLIDEHLFTGDTLFSGSIGRTDLPGGNLEILLNSIHEKIMPLNNSIVVHAGHGPDSSIGEEKRKNPFLQS